MANQTPLVDESLIREMLYDDDGYVKEFSNASIQSFGEFKKHFKESVMARDLDDLRRAGHKIKPVAMMLHLDSLIEMYETSKTYLEENKSTEKLTDLTRKMDSYCEKVIAEFHELI